MEGVAPISLATASTINFDTLYRSGSISISEMLIDLNSSINKRSVTILFVKTELPAPITHNLNIIYPFN